MVENFGDKFRDKVEIVWTYIEERQWTKDNMELTDGQKRKRPQGTFMELVKEILQRAGMGKEDAVQ